MTLDFDKDEIFNIETGETVADIENMTVEEINVIQFKGGKSMENNKQLFWVCEIRPNKYVSEESNSMHIETTKSLINAMKVEAEIFDEKSICLLAFGFSELDKRFAKNKFRLISVTYDFVN